MLAAPATLPVATRLTGGDPHGLAPSQWADRLGASSPPELRLMAAVMIDAIRDFRHAGDTCGPRARELARLATRWILSTDASWPFSFESICAVFDVEAGDLRRTLLRERALGTGRRPRRHRHNMVLSGVRPAAHRVAAAERAESTRATEVA